MIFIYKINTSELGVKVMKKLFIIAMLMAMGIGSANASYLDKQIDEVDKNVLYNTPEQHTKVYDLNKEYSVEIADGVKDLGLIKFAKYTPIDDKLYNKKLKDDEVEYNKKIKPALKKKTKTVNVEPEAVDFYNVYRIAERLIRANNLDYINWRIAIRKTAVSNASAFDGNYIAINTGLYDSVYESEDALAFVIAHEMAHHILGHIQRTVELYKTLDYYDSLIATARKSKDDTAALNELVAETQKLKVYKKLRAMEYMADVEALTLITKAGYSPYKGIETLNYFNTFSKLETIESTHPSTAKRIESYNENLTVLDPNWKFVGRENIYNSHVLNCKKSSDRVSIVISKSKTSKNFYKVENKEEKLTRIAHIKYLRGDMKEAIKFFSLLTDENKDNYIPYVYMSYANEYVYKQTGKKRFLRRAKKSIIKAAKLNPADDNVIMQIKNLGITQKNKQEKTETDDEKI